MNDEKCRYHDDCEERTKERLDAIWSKLDSHSDQLKEIYKRIGEVERDNTRRGEQFSNLEKTLTEIMNVQKENKQAIENLQKSIGEQQNNLIVQMMEKQDSMLKMFVEKDKQEKQAELKLQQADRKTENQLKLNREKKFWDIIWKVIVALIAALTLYSNFIVKN